MTSRGRLLVKLVQDKSGNETELTRPGQEMIMSTYEDSNADIMNVTRPNTPTDLASTVSGNEPESTRPGQEMIMPTYEDSNPDIIMNVTFQRPNTPTDLASTVSGNHSTNTPTDVVSSVSFFDDSQADPDFQPSVSNISQISITSLDYNVDFNSLLFVGRASTPNEVDRMDVDEVNEEAPLIPNAVQSDITDNDMTYVSEHQLQSEKQRINQNLQNKKTVKKLGQKNKHKILPCQCKCISNKCNAIFNEEDRVRIWSAYWDLSYGERRKWLAKCVRKVNIQRRRVNQDRITSSRKKESRNYFLQKDGVEHKVCLNFFLKTLGYTSDSVIKSLTKAMNRAPILAEVKENRGRKKCTEVPNHQLIREHIMSYHPVIAHYRRHNAPKMKYMPPGLTIEKLFNDFNEQHPNKCSKETYRRVLKDSRVSLKTPENDECGECALYTQAKCDVETIDPEIEANYNMHINKAEDAQKEYKKDAKAVEGAHLKIFSMDLQKVLLLPYMPKNKEAFFISRLIVFNETFASLKKNSKANYCILWHEALAGRDAPQIIDSILTFLKAERDTTNFILWMDNCTAQNKNWYLFTALVTIVNSDIVNTNLNTITLKYLTKGHTHMTADGIHGNIEKQLKRNENIYDFRDLTDVVKKSRKHLNVIPVETFHNWPKKLRSSRKVNDPLTNFKLNQIVEAKFTRGERAMHYKKCFSQEYEVLNFLQSRFASDTIPTTQNVERGINRAKKQNIVSKLVPMMPTNRHVFWQNLPEVEGALDLVHEGEMMVEEE